ncbi:hypothetical protein QY97_02344 [Bacillus thermotolerans]|uniref:Uncharacterized protein n=1 Tax=Bacillus thermotolerans TaxID=1221996 RepID=A0A0F5HYK6_BACTR|nr:hypothetical protein QY95_02729 [Bacillus thermotolerans]KKB37967.1 hypothetical protein QY96_03127 [Bacillus thermotolerans]KKB38435.1 hypothetical protein QY97_02344 [Bacillus thermotolerans]
MASPSKQFFSLFYHTAGVYSSKKKPPFGGSNKYRLFLIWLPLNSSL